MIEHSEQEIRLEVIKALISSNQLTNMRGNIETVLAHKADPLVDYVLGRKPEPEASADKPEGPAPDAEEKEATPQGQTAAEVPALVK